MSHAQTKMEDDCGWRVAEREKCPAGRVWWWRLSQPGEASGYCVSYSWSILGCDVAKVQVEVGEAGKEARRMAAGQPQSRAAGSVAILIEGIGLWRPQRRVRPGRG